MIPVLLETLAIAASGLLAFGSMTLVILLLLSDRGVGKASAYVLGYAFGYGTIGVGAVLLRAGSTSAGGGGPNAIVGGTMLAFACLLLWLSWHSARQPPVEGDAPPRLFSRIDGLGAPAAFGLGVAVTLINFKNLGLFMSALSVVLLSRLPLGQQLAVVAMAVVVFCLGVAAPVVVVVSAPTRATALLTRLKEALVRYRRPLSVWAPLCFALILVAKGLRLLGVG